VFANLISAKPDMPKNKLSVKDITEFNLSYAMDDFSDVIFGLKLFSDICIEQSGDYFYTGDIRVAYKDVPRSYIPPINELFDFLPEEQKKIAFSIHKKLEDLKCVYDLEKGYMLKYINPKAKGQVFATIYFAEDLYFLPEPEKWKKVTFKFNLRNIGKYINYLTECTDSISQSILKTEKCGGCAKNCGGVIFTYQGKTYTKCLTHIFRLWDLSAQSVENYVKLLELEDQAMQ
jgi:hypothetical protein